MTIYTTVNGDGGFPRVHAYTSIKNLCKYFKFTGLKMATCPVSETEIRKALKATGEVYLYYEYEEPTAGWVVYIEKHDT